MRILLYNIRYATGYSKSYHLPIPFAGFFRFTTGNLQEIINYIYSVDPDIIALVEVDAGSYRSGFDCQAELIGKALHYDHIIESKYGEESLATKIPILNRQANALLSRHPIANHKFHYFDDGVKKLIIQVIFEKFTVFVVHLSLAFRHRQNQLEYLYHLITTQEMPVIVAGDFNTFWGSRELKLFLSATGLANADPDNQPSHPSRAPFRQLDFILHSKEIKVSSFSVPSVQLSDHAPLICDFNCCDLSMAS